MRRSSLENTRVPETILRARDGPGPFLVAGPVDIDHHSDNEGFGDASYVDRWASFAAPAVLGSLEAAAASIDGAVAAAPYVGILTDTGRSRSANTDARTFRAAG